MTAAAAAVTVSVVPGRKLKSSLRTEIDIFRKRFAFKRKGQEYHSGKGKIRRGTIRVNKAVIAGCSDRKQIDETPSLFRCFFVRLTILGIEPIVGKKHCLRERHGSLSVQTHQQIPSVLFKNGCQIPGFGCDIPIFI